jgi:hypothetical protein
MNKLTETILVLVIILAALLVFNYMVKPAFEGVATKTVKSISSSSVSNRMGAL